MWGCPPEKIRNVALVGHCGAGKTTLGEALLCCSGVLARPGRVEDGTTVGDFQPEAVRHQMSVTVAVAPFPAGARQEFKVNLLDTPGYPDFLAEVEAALYVADLAVVVVSAVEGVEVQTEAVWRLCAERGLPRLIFVNKLDRERASFEATLASLNERFGSGIAPLELPLGDEGSFYGVADLLSDQAITTVDAKTVTGPIPAELVEAEARVRENLLEGIVVGDDDLMTRYLDGAALSAEELEATLAKGVAAGSVFPVICGSALRSIGVERLASLITEIAPSPLLRGPARVRAGDREVEVAPDPDGDPLARVWKTVADPFVGKISLLHVLSGTLRPDMTLADSRTHTDHRLHGLFGVRGKEIAPVPHACVGDIVAVTKLGEIMTGDTLAPKSLPVTAVSPPPVTPVFSIAIRPEAKGDDDKLMTALHRLAEEDPSLVFDRDDETHQMLLRGMGETHLQIVTEVLRRKFGVQVVTEEVKVPYRETITATASAEGRYKKQTGGHGQYGVVDLSVEPLGRGEGFVFVDQIVGGAIPRQFLPAIEKGIEEAMAAGGPHGFPVVDVKVICFDGKFHPVDSSEMSFKMAGAIAFKEAVALASPVVLEPYSRLEVTLSPAYQGDVLGDLAARRARVLATTLTEDGADQVIVALLPRAETLRYAIDLRALTAGHGRFRLTHDHYDIVPLSLSSRLG
jgi:elongation factor G